jgi:uncharacterized membrane protein
MTPGGRDGDAEGGSAEARGAAPGPPPKQQVTTLFRGILAVAMVTVGITHFADPETFLRMVPRGLPWPLFLVYFSGAAELAGGAGLFVPRLRRAASWGLIALYLAVFPANVNMALNNLALGDYHAPAWVLWTRLPLQLVFIAWAYWVGKPPTPSRAAGLR